jgi:hypothetical protein
MQAAYHGLDALMRDWFNDFGIVESKGGSSKLHRGRGQMADAWITKNLKKMIRDNPGANEVNELTRAMATNRQFSAMTVAINISERDNYLAARVLAYKGIKSVRDWGHPFV